MRVRRTTKILLAMVGFGLAVALAIGGFSGSAQLALHGSFWITVVFGLWLEAHLLAS